MIAQWKMNDNILTTTVVDSVGGNTGTFGDATGDPNTSAHSTTGKIREALTFDGTDDYIVVPADPNIDANGKTALTISAWINPASDGENHQGRIFDKGNSSSGYISWVSNEGGGKVTISFSVIMTGTNSLAVKTAALSINTWQHLVFTYNEDGDKKSKIFIDGSEASLSTDTAGTGSTADDSGDDLYIGNRILADSTFNGLIDNVMIFDKALSAAEAKYLYNNGRGRESIGQRDNRSRYSDFYRKRYRFN